MDYFASWHLEPNPHEQPPHPDAAEGPVGTAPVGHVAETHRSAAASARAAAPAPADTPSIAHAAAPTATSAPTRAEAPPAPRAGSSAVPPESAVRTDRPADTTSAIPMPHAPERAAPWSSTIPPWVSPAATWRQTVLRHCDEGHVALASARAHGLTQQQAAIADEVARLMHEARHIAREVRVSALRWWTGADIEHAWRCLREAEERLVDICPAAELGAAGADALAHARRSGLGDDDPVVAHLCDLRRGNGIPPTPTLRAAVRATLRNAHAATDRRMSEIRQVRNRTLLAAGLAALAAAALVGMQASAPHLVVLAVPAGAAAVPAWALLGAVMLFGAIGAVFTLVPVLSAQPPDHSPFNLPVPQALVKLAVGMLTAVVGVAAVCAVAAGGLTTTAALPLTLPALFLLAVVFGAGQQAVTRYVDRRAAAVLAAA